MNVWKICIESPEGCVYSFLIDGTLVKMSGKTDDERRKFLLAEIEPFIEGIQVEVQKRDRS